MAAVVSLCPRYHHAVELIGRRWTGAIIRCLLHGRARYNELRTIIPEISDRMLSERLRELELEGVVVRTVIPDSPVRVEYELTAKGRALEDAVVAIGEWAGKWVTAEDVARGADSPPAKSSSAKVARPAAKATARVVAKRARDVSRHR
jgi:DNA-binding HxlR family transcriptional regulator